MVGGTGSPENRERDMSKINFGRYAITMGKVRASVFYSLDNRVDGRQCVTIYSRDYGHALCDIFGRDVYKNDTDTMTDYFDKGRVVLFSDHPLYAAARTRAETKYEPRQKTQVAAQFTRKDVDTVETTQGAHHYTVTRKAAAGRTYYVVHVVNPMVRAYRRGFAFGKSFNTLADVERAYKGLAGIAAFFAVKPRGRMVDGKFQMVAA